MFWIIVVFGRLLKIEYIEELSEWCLLLIWIKGFRVLIIIYLVDVDVVLM